MYSLKFIVLVSSQKQPYFYSVFSLSLTFEILRFYSGTVETTTKGISIKSNSFLNFLLLDVNLLFQIKITILFNFFLMISVTWPVKLARGSEAKCISGMENITLYTKWLSFYRTDRYNRVLIIKVNKMYNTIITVSVFWLWSPNLWLWEGLLQMVLIYWALFNCSMTHFTMCFSFTHPHQHS